MCPNRANNRQRVQNSAANCGGVPAQSSCQWADPGVSAQMYGAQKLDAFAPSVPCYDTRCGNRTYNCKNRNPFWPSFAHPRWLNCNQLYNCR